MRNDGIWLQYWKHPQLCCNSAGNRTSGPVSTWESVCFHKAHRHLLCNLTGGLLNLSHTSASVKRGLNA